MAEREEKKKPRLPKQQLLILAICRFAEPVAMTSVYPYIPEMIQSFNVPTGDVAKWAGLMAATFSMSQCLTAIAWGRASDKFGRKPMIVASLTCTMFSGLLFGFSPTLTWAFIARSIQGLSCGNVGIVRTTVAEMVPEKELQPRAFSLMPLVWNIGSIFGPAFGGSLVHPAERFGLFKNSKLFQQYPFSLPNITASFLFLIGISSGILFLKESLEEKKSRRDYGLMLGSLLTRSCRKRPTKARHIKRDSLEAAPFLSSLEGSEMEDQSPRKHSPRIASVQTPKPATKPKWADVFTPQSNVNLVVYTFLAMHSVAYDQLLPIYLHHPIQPREDSNIKLPLKFAGGFGLNSDSIGWIFMVYGIVGMLIQFILFPPFARKYGVLFCLKCCAIFMPITYALTPFVTLPPTNVGRMSLLGLLMFIKCFCTIFAFPCSTILLTNSATSLKILGTLNGVATSISAAGRAAGPALTGATFSIGVDIGYIILPWWTLTAIGLVGAVPVWFLIEMEGFSSNTKEDNTAGEHSSDDDDDETNGLVRSERDEIEDAVFDDDPMEPIDPLLLSQSQDHPGGPPASTSNDLIASPTQNQTQPTRHRNFSTSQSRLSIPDRLPPNENPIYELPRQDQSDDSPADATQRRKSTDVKRQSMDLPALYRTTSPIGFGKTIARGIQRSYSSDLGATNSGLGTGGSAWH